MTARKKNQNSDFSLPVGGGSTGPISGVGMSPIERIRNIKAMQKLSPFVAINDALKKLDLRDFGLGKRFFESSEEELQNALTQINSIKKKENEYNYHIPGLTKSVGGQEVPIHNIFDHNTKLRDVRDVMNKEQKGGFVATDWFPKLKRGVFHQSTDHPQNPGQIR